MRHRCKCQKGVDRCAVFVEIIGQKWKILISTCCQGKHKLMITLKTVTVDNGQMTDLVRYIYNGPVIGKFHIC